MASGYVVGKNTAGIRYSNEALLFVYINEQLRVCEQLIETPTSMIRFPTMDSAGENFDPPSSCEKLDVYS